MATKAHLDGNKRYLDKLDEIKVRLPKGRKGTIQAYAEAVNQSVNAFVTTAIDERIERMERGTGGLEGGQ